MRFDLSLGMSLAASLAAAALLGACSAVQGPADVVTQITASDPTTPYLGMTKSEVIACAGPPHSRYDAEGSEILTYHYNGAGPVPAPEKKSARR